MTEMYHPTEEKMRLRESPTSNSSILNTPKKMPGELGEGMREKCIRHNSYQKARTWCFKHTLMLQLKELRASGKIKKPKQVKMTALRSG